MGKGNLVRKKIRSASFLCLCLLWQLAAAGSLCSQQPKPAVASQENVKTPSAAAEEELRKGAREQQITRILSLLKTTAYDAQNWPDATAASRFQAQTADVLWDADADIARGLLVKAWERAGTVEDPKSERSRFRNDSQRIGARREVILVARSRAPELARKWLDQMAQEAEQTKTERGAFDDRTPRSTLLLQMALQVVDEDPNAAASLLIESLQDGISFAFQQGLIRIQEKNVDLAHSVFRAALSRLRTVGMLDPNELLILHAYMFTPGRVVAANTDADPGHIKLAVGRNPSQIVAAAQLNPALAAEFLQLAANLLIRAPLPATTADPTLEARLQLSVIKTLMGPVSKHFPELAVVLKTRAQQIATDARFSTARQSAPANMPASLPGETSVKYADRRVDLLEEAAQNESYTLGRDIAFAKAALATSVEKYSRGWDLAGKIEDRTLRDNVRNWLTYRASLQSINVNNLERAYELAGKNTDPIQRPASLIVGAQRLLKAKNTTRAGQWLQEARLLIRKVEPDEDSVHVAFGISAAFGKFDKGTAFETLSEAVRQLEKVTVGSGDEDRAPSANRFSGLETPADFTYGTNGFSLRAAIDTFGPEQFEDVLGIVDRIPQPALHGMAIMTLCQKYLKASDVRPPG